ncbi:uncharacterized protein LOC120700979 [Panicum virgatum]|uniref:uncharacterized protein LOC120700979 n=1 Tax=Panicum virgatum TaxID=38727 RepID=UPI0019D5D01B|nr:uncharacterized protein LOC120700979 [Panicum virgatum]
MEARSETTMYCACLDCGNYKKYSDFEVVYAHLIIRGFVPNYTCWNKHREEGYNERGEWVADTQEGCRDVDQDGQGNYDQERCRDDINEECILEFSEHQFDALVDNVEEMIHDVRGEHEMTEAELRKYKQFVEDSKKPLYPHCEKYSRVTGDLKLLQLKAAHGWIDKSFKALLLLRKDMLPEGNLLPDTVYKAKQIVYKCRKDGGDDGEDSMDERKKETPRKVAWNIRFALSTDGMNLYGNMSISHRTWPVLLSIMNLPPWLCNKLKYIMLSTLVSGPKQPGDRIDVFLQPLVKDLQLLWEGVEVRDVVVNKHFTLHAMLMTTISDNPAHRNLFRQSKRKGQVCSRCLSETCSLRLKNSNKFAYMGHRRWLPKNHPYRSMDKQFNGTRETRNPPPHFSGKDVYRQVKDVSIVLGKQKCEVDQGGDDDCHDEGI